MSLRFSIGSIVGALAAAVLHSAGQSLTVSYLVGVGLIIAIWFRLAEAAWALFVAVGAYLLFGGQK